MEVFVGILGAALALLAVFILYLGAVAVVFRFIALLRPQRAGTEREPSVPASAP